MTSKLIAIGLVTGICNGLFGSGGGTILVPGMVFLMGLEEHKAHATAILVILPLTVLSTVIYYKNSYIDWPTTLKVVSGGMVGSFIGARVFNKIPASVLRKVFGAFMIAAAVRMVFWLLIIIIGLLSGIISAMGIGGGAVLIPALTLFAGSKQHTAQSINLISFVPVAIIALIIHYRKNNLNTGYSFTLILSGLVGALIGSGLAVRLPAEILSKLFAVFLFIMGGMEILYKDPK